ncbi:rhomboid family intramembrane serine protease [Magnetospira sp. QH-2]|uniref:rhomboid family intramembrane serine protease n=1 Tax=Magnetospira sp. (strain QH-2) TaxID=1288970 RepID=UPI0003E81BA0|nr:rhomboid family intramembrane serine protease [Magnetospira sp. QH-2]CCQ73546.1 Conserved protein of unknown function. Containing rhomboid protease domain [Magnetospira sp. QH-2]
MIPLHDDTPTTRKPVVTVGLIVACVGIFLWQWGLSDRESLHAALQYGFLPRAFFDGQSVFASGLPPWPTTALTYQFMHGGWWHLISNMLYLWVFGNNIEDTLGHGKYLLFYLVCGVLAAGAQGLSTPDSILPMIGASGAVSGVLGAYIVLFPRANVLVLIPLVIFFWTTRIPALIVLGLWFLFQFVQATGETGEGGVAFWAHVGGFVAGMILIFVFRGKRPPAEPPHPPRRHKLIPDSGK